MNEKFFLEEYNNLNTEQKEAVDNIYWPLMVIAWPGTWKTQIIWMRTANIIRTIWANAENILITTFTEAWVIAIRKRLVKFLWQEWYKVKVSTFHSFASEVISEFPEKFLEQRAKKTIDDIESYEIISSILDSNIEKWEIKELFSPWDRMAYLRDIKDRIGKLKTEWLTPDWFDIVIKKQEKEYEQKIEELQYNNRIRNLEKRQKDDKEKYDKHINKLKELNLVYKEYNKSIREKWLYDFADMINFVTEKFKNDEEIVAYYAEKFQFIMIDEFQDTNNSQNNIIDLILEYFPEEQNIMVVWDDDQSIYRFQWANIENMLDFSKKYPHTKNIVLSHNYRSSQKILDISKNLIENNKQRISNRIKNIDKELIASWENKDINCNNFYLFENDIKEKEYVYREIKEKYNQNENFAIIVKTNKQITEWSDFLTQKWLEVNSKNSSNILKNKFCDFLLNFLQLVDNPYFDDEKLINTLRSELVNIENIDIIHINRVLFQKNYKRRKNKLSIWDIIKNIEDSDEDFKEEIKDIDKIIEFREFVLDLNKNTWIWAATNIIRETIEKTWLFEYIEDKWDINDLQDIFTLINKIKSFIEIDKNISIKNIINKFDLYNKFWISISRENIKSINSKIEILTAHASKWLEYDIVFIPEVYEWNWNKKAMPNKLKLPIWISWEWLQYADLSESEYKELEKEISKEEERRLFFVALTRAKKSLIFTMPQSKENKLLIKSSFVEETLIENKEKDLDLSDKELKNILKSSIKDTDLIKNTKQELDYISKFLENYKISPTDLNKFIDDPQKFLREVIFRYPFLSNENLVFWSAYHKILEKLWVSKIENKHISLEEAKEIFLEELDRYDNSPEEYDRLKERWINWIEWYYNIFQNNNRKILNTEYNFNPKNIIFEWIPLTWKVDKIELVDWNDIALIDYKTWSIKWMSHIKWIDRNWNKKYWDWRWNYLRQLLFYKLMFDNNRELKSKYNLWELGIDFVEGKKWEYKYIPIDYTKEEYENFISELKDSWGKINNISFWEDLLNIKD